MSRSRRKTPIRGWTMSPSEKEYKRHHNRRFRRITRERLQCEDYDSAPVDPNEISNVWNWSKDGKYWWGNEYIDSMSRPWKYRGK